MIHAMRKSVIEIGLESGGARVRGVQYLLRTQGDDEVARARHGFGIQRRQLDLVRQSIRPFGSLFDPGLDDLNLLLGGVSRWAASAIQNRTQPLGERKPFSLPPGTTLRVPGFVTELLRSTRNPLCCLVGPWPAYAVLPENRLHVAPEIHFRGSLRKATCNKTKAHHGGIFNEPEHPLSPRF